MWADRVGDEILYRVKRGEGEYPTYNKKQGRRTGLVTSYVGIAI